MDDRIEIDFIPSNSIRMLTNRAITIKRGIGRACRLDSTINATHLIIGTTERPADIDDFTIINLEGPRSSIVVHGRIGLNVVIMVPRGSIEIAAGSILDPSVTDNMQAQVIIRKDLRA